ncbi:hypothetical protein T10_12145 [Trichinella papuae]|uniref:Uncharacterized protein n=1 Tax=Trichinella papuae TaxID=268474 RepID=A0A0V1M5H1_9BILA|nr:hypothetical protein T10_12145 [Trichinella papuae]
MIQIENNDNADRLTVRTTTLVLLSHFPVYIAGMSLLRGTQRFFPVDCLPCGCFVTTPPTHDIPGTINRNRVLFVRVASLAASFTHGRGLHCCAISSVIRLGQAIDGVLDPYAWAQHTHAFDVLGAAVPHH